MVYLRKRLVASCYNLYLSVEMLSCCSSTDAQRFKATNGCLKGEKIVSWHDQHTGKTHAVFTTHYSAEDDEMHHAERRRDTIHIPETRSRHEAEKCYWGLGASLHRAHLGTGYIPHLYQNQSFLRLHEDVESLAVQRSLPGRIQYATVYLIPCGEANHTQ